MYKKRELHLEAEIMKVEQAKLAKAHRFCRIKRLSTYFLMWQQWVLSEKEAIIIKELHIKRALKMEDFMKKLKEKHIRNKELNDGNENKKELKIMLESKVEHPIMNEVEDINIEQPTEKTAIIKKKKIKVEQPLKILRECKIRNGILYLTKL
jgi:hypothetical protein